MKIHCVAGSGLDSNTYIMEANKSYIVDAGTGLNTRPVIKKVATLNLETKIEGIILTHRHIDHSGGAKTLADEYKCPIYSSEQEAAALRNPNDPTTCSAMAGINFPALSVTPLGSRLDCRGDTIDIILSPGHTDGHIALYHKKSGSLICGDVLFCYGGVGRWDLPTGNYKKLKDTISALSELDVEAVYPGHGPYVETNGREHVKLALANLSGWV